jgi:hypothetical protein
MERRYTVVCEWQSIHRDDEFDCDEIQVGADSAASAIKKAREKWSATIGAAWPHLRIVKAWILSPSAHRGARQVVLFCEGNPSNDAGVPSR